MIIAFGIIGRLILSFVFELFVKFVQVYFFIEIKMFLFYIFILILEGVFVGNVQVCFPLTL